MTDTTSPTAAADTDSVIVIPVTEHNGVTMTGSVSPVRYLIVVERRALERYGGLGPYEGRSDVIVSDTIPVPEFRVPHAMPRGAQLDAIARLSAQGRRVPLERARFGWADAPRRPCFRRVRTR